MKIAPSEKQLTFLDWEFGVFFHFGIRSFFPGHADWDGQPMPASAFNPTELDCRQWIRHVSEAGAKYTILTTKHHDGFALWPSQYSAYSVAHSPWKNGQGDVVREFVNACRRYKIKVGLYYSPAQWNAADREEEVQDYDEIFLSQIRELLTDYGEIDYLWFDACGSEKHEYDRERIIRTIRSLQPGIRIFSMWDPDTRWIGNEDGYAPMPNVNTVDKAEFSIFATEQRSVGSTRFLPAECDMRLRTTWFDCEANEDRIKSVQELLGIWEYSVGRGANLLLNIGPDRRGLLPEADAARLLEFGRALKDRYGTPLPFTETEIREQGDFIIATRKDFPPEHVGTELTDTVVIEEDITEGEAIEEFRVWCRLPGDWRGQSVCVYTGTTVGHKAICRFPLIRTAQIRVEIVKAKPNARIRSVKAYKVN